MLEKEKIQALKDRLEKDLRESEKSYAAAWQEYGSELGSDDHSRILRKHIHILDEVLSGRLHVDPHYDELDFGVLTRLAGMIKELQDSEKNIRDRIERRRIARELIAKDSQEPR